MRRIRAALFLSMLVSVLVIDVLPAFAATGWNMALPPPRAPGVVEALPGQGDPLGSALPAGPGLELVTPSYLFKWGTAGSGNSQFLNPCAVATDERGYVYVADTNNNRVQKFTSTGAYVTSWGSLGTGNGQFQSPYGVFVDRRGYVWVSSYIGDHIQKFTNNGAFIAKYTVGGALDGPIGMCQDERGYVYVACYLGHRIVRLSYADGSYQGETLIGPGADPGESSYPLGIDIDSSENLWVAEFGNSRLQKFYAPIGGANTSVYGTGGPGPGQFRALRHVKIDPFNRIWVSEGSPNNRGQILTTAGTNDGYLGIAGSGDALIREPWGIGIDGTGVYYSSATSSTVKKYTSGSTKSTLRVGGADRYEVAVNLAKTRWPGYADIDHVIVVCGEDRASADPLAAAQLAGVWDAPVLLTQSATLNTRTKAALAAMRSANGPLKIHVIGGTVSVPPAVYNAIAATNNGGTLERISGADRYALSAEMAKRLKTELESSGRIAPAVLLFNGETPAAFYDALAASPIAARAHVAMMAVKKNAVPISVSSALANSFPSRPRYIVNSTTYVSSVTYAAAAASGRLTTSSNRVTAATQIATWARTRGYLLYRHAGVANKLPDALTGGAFVGMQDGVLLYTDAGALPSGTGSFATTNRYGIYRGYVFGGTASVSDSTKSSFNTKIR